MLVLEMVPALLSAELTQELQHCHTIGIGAGNGTAGQVLVMHDMLGMNLLTALVASRVIGAFEATIQQQVALAALMPVVASIGGNTGNQTVALMIRGMALEQIVASSLWVVVRKELSIALVNGLLWGSVVALAALLFYRQPALSLVMGSAVAVNLLIASLAGVFIPLALEQTGRDPVLGSSVLLTFVTDAMGFLVFLGLAAWLIVG